MAVGPFVLAGIGGGSTTALFVTEGFGSGEAVPVTVVVGGIPKRRAGKRCKITIDGVDFIASSALELGQLVRQWRKDHPRIVPEPPKPVPVAKQPRGRRPKPQEAIPAAPVPVQAKLTVLPTYRPQERFPGLPAALAAFHFAEMDRRAAELAQIQAIAEALAIADAEDEDDIETILMILASL